MRVSDTDLEARELFKFFAPNASQVSFGKGKIIFKLGRQGNGAHEVTTS